MAVFKTIYGHLLDFSGVANIPTTLASLRSLKGNVGDTVVIKNIGSNGSATEFSAAAAVAIDNSLSISGQAADAKAVGDALGRYIDDIDALIGGGS